MAEDLQENQNSSGKLELWFLNRGLFSDHFLQARLPQWEEWQVGEELSTFRQGLLSLYEQKKIKLPTLNEAQTEDEFIKPVLDLLGYANSYMVQPHAKTGKQAIRPDYFLFPDEASKDEAYLKLKKKEKYYTKCIGIADAKYWERDLDLSKSNWRDIFSNLNPSFQIINYLIGAQQDWGILTNGRLWRLYSLKSHDHLGDYYQVDMVQLLEAPEEKLKYFYLFFRKAALLYQPDIKSFLDRVLEGSNAYAVELEADIKERAYEVVDLLCRGFATGFPPEQLTPQVLSDIYDGSLILLYRLLFVFYAEARELLPLTTSADYRNMCSLRRLTDDIAEKDKKGYEPSDKLTDCYHYLHDLFQLIDGGDRSKGIPEYNGGLFEPQEHQFLEKQTIADAFLVRAIRHLTWVTDKKLGRVVAVDYNTLTERHLGSIYEGLLEFRPRIAPYDLVIIKDKNSIRYAHAKDYPGKDVKYHKGELYLANDRGERRASGSYYTPEYIVNYIVDNTLDPLAKQVAGKVKALKPEIDEGIARLQEMIKDKLGLEPVEKYDLAITKERERLLEPYLSLKVLDPAMGSGHFLARATDFLAEAVATDPSIELPKEITEETELTYYRRRVVENCIYGVDLNPLAVELAKLTLWLSTMAKTKPLSFLNHHLKVGNSLIGAKVADLDEIPKAKGKKAKSIDLSRAPKQIGQFEWIFNNKIALLLESRALIAQIPTETLHDIHNKEKWELDFEHNAERFRLLADIWISTNFGNTISWDTYNKLLDNIQVNSSEWENLIQNKRIEKAELIRLEKHFFHWELEFPEVFYEKDGKRKADAGFDAVVGNPPYDVLEKERLGKQNPHIELAQYLENSPSYYPALGGKVNLFRPFLIQECLLLKRGGVIGKIVPLAIANDFSCTRTRNYILKELSLLQLECFPQKDDPRDRVFEDAKLSTCILIANKVGATTKFTVRIYPGKYLTKNPKKVEVSLKDIESVDPDVLPIPLVTQAEWNLAVKIHSYLPISRISQIATLTRGEINQTIFSEFITANPLHHEMIKGVEIDRYGEHLYLSQGEKQWFDEDLFHAKTKSSKTIPPFRIGVQRITGIDDRIRLIATFINRCVYFADSTNSIVSDDPEKLNFLLSLLNSRFFNWRFKLTSTNNNVSTNELDRLPIRQIDFTTLKKERKQLLEQGKELYQEYLQSHKWDKLLAFVAQRLPQKSGSIPDTENEQSDVVHDLLAFLAEEMTRLNKEKQSRIKGFLVWLEKEILKGSVEGQHNKTKIRDFHDGTFEELLGILKKNKAIFDPYPPEKRAMLEHIFSDAVNAITPLKTDIQATDDLIDQIVYKLYGLTDDEKAIVEGQQSHSE
jgi:Alw26I/Eco31I/Esp3I family type II restriction m6 adenine DNA methyltransferase